MKRSGFQIGWVCSVQGQCVDDMEAKILGIIDANLDLAVGKPSTNLIW